MEHDFIHGPDLFLWAFGVVCVYRCIHRVQFRCARLNPIPGGLTCDDESYFKYSFDHGLDGGCIGTELVGCVPLKSGRGRVEACIPNLDAYKDEN